MMDWKAATWPSPLMEAAEPPVGAPVESMEMMMVLGVHDTTVLVEVTQVSRA